LLEQATDAVVTAGEGAERVSAFFIDARRNSRAGKSPAPAAEALC